MKIVKTNINNDGVLLSVALYLLEEAKVTREGEKFKKLVPSMVFFIFYLEARLFTCADHVFLTNSERDRFKNCSLENKVTWLSNRMNFTQSEALKELISTAEIMRKFRNSLVHSENITITEERELIGLEKYGQSFLQPSISNDNFMETATFDNAQIFLNAVTLFDRMWINYSKIHFPNDDFETRLDRLSRDSSVKTVD